jgi:hypothetical protein
MFSKETLTTAILTSVLVVGGFYLLRKQILAA